MTGRELGVRAAGRVPQTVPQMPSRERHDPTGATSTSTAVPVQKLHTGRAGRAVSD